MPDYYGESFVSQFKAGEASEDDIDDFIDTWHEDQDIQSPLHEYLGMT